MKLYVTHLGRWAGTQAEAKAIGKEDGGWKEYDVATDKTGLLVFLNHYRVGFTPDCDGQPEAPPSDDDISDLLGDDEPAVEEILSAKLHVPGPYVPKLADVIDWVLDVATPPQVEGVFTALGTRFHEAVKDKAND